MTCLYLCAMEVEGKTLLISSNQILASYYCTRHLSYANCTSSFFAICQARSHSSELSYWNVFLFLFFANCHMMSPFLQKSLEWEMKWQPAVLIRICCDEVPSLNFGRLMGRWSWNTCPRGRRTCQGCPRGQGGGA